MIKEHDPDWKEGMIKVEDSFTCTRFFFSSRRRHTRFDCDWSSDVCSSDLAKVPIIFLTAKDATEDKVHGLTIGGDDYVTKPFSIEELMARVRVVLRRHGNNAETGKLALADLELDDEAHEVRRHGHVVELTNTEYRLLRYLLINAGRVLTRSQILDHVWHYDFGGDASVLETYISYLRRKVDRYDPPLVQTVRGVGYVLRTPRK